MRPITASDLMNPQVLTVQDDMSVRDLAAFLVDNEISGAPVEDAEGRLVGVVSMTDIAALASGDPAPSLEEPVLEEEEEEEDTDPRVSDIMTRAVYSVREDATVSEVATTMLKGHLHRLVVTREDQAVGIISTSDLLGLLVGEK
jgi:CBS domain-containing protein